MEVIELFLGGGIHHFPHRRCRDDELWSEAAGPWNEFSWVRSQFSHSLVVLTLAKVLGPSGLQVHHLKNKTKKILCLDCLRFSC